MPKRIQRQRVKGWRMPEGALYVGRPGVRGNPFVVGHRFDEGDSFLKHYGQYLDDGLVTADNCLVAFEAYCRKILATAPNWLEPLRDYEFLACWCPLSQPCHVDIYLKLLAEFPPVHDTGEGG